MRSSNLLAAMLFTAVLSARGQGTLTFANLATGVDAPVYNCSIGVRLTNTLVVADLYFSTTTNAPTDALQPAGFNVPFSTTTAGGGGYFLGGTRTVTGATGFIEAQVRVWDSSFGSYEQARSLGGLSGFSLPIIINLAVPPVPPTPMTGLQSFVATDALCPEPQSFSLAGLAAALLFAFHRRTSKSRQGL